MESFLPQIVAIGIYNAEMAVKNRTVTHNRKTTMFEIELPTEAGGVSYVDAEEMPISPDTVICARPGQMRHTRLPFRCYYIHLILKEGALYDALIHTPTFVKVRNAEKYKEIFEKLCQYHDSRIPDDTLMIYSLLFELVYMLSADSQRQLHRCGAEKGHFETVEKTIRYINSHLTSDLSLAAVAAYAGWSPIYFHTCFKSATGKTLHEYVEEQRIRKASTLLVTTDWTLTEISYECGFSSQSYFSYAFKRKMHMTPREYAREVYKKYDS